MGRRKQTQGRVERLRALLSTGFGQILVRLTAASVVFLLAGIVMRQARAYTYRLEDFRVGPETLSFVGLPAWMEDERAARALDPRQFRSLSVSIYDPDAADILAAQIRRHPMLSDVRNVRLRYPDSAEVEPVLRVPVARVAVWVQGREGHQVLRWRLLSDDGCLLPRAPYKGYLASVPHELPTVVGIREYAPLDSGEVWEDRTQRVAEAVAAAQMAGRLFRDLRGRVYVTRIDVSRFPASGETRDAGEVRLVLSCPSLDGGGPRVMRTVEWGRTERARAEVPWEDDYATKLQRLRDALTSPRPPRLLDVRWELPRGGRTAP